MVKRKLAVLTHFRCPHVPHRNSASNIEKRSRTVKQRLLTALFLPAILALTALGGSGLKGGSKVGHVGGSIVDSPVVRFAAALDISPVQQRVDSGGASVYGVAPHSDLHCCRLLKPATEGATQWPSRSIA